MLKKRGGLPTELSEEEHSSSGIHMTQRLLPSSIRLVWNSLLLATFIEASLSEPHSYEKYSDYVCLCISIVRLAINFYLLLSL